MPVAQYTEHNTFPTSTALTQAWYDLPSETVYVEVRNTGGIYGYKDFSSEHWREFIEDASSAGRYWGWIKNNFDSVGRFSERPGERKFVTTTQVQEPENTQSKFRVKVHVVADYELTYECDSVVEAHGLATMYLDSKFRKVNDKSKIVYRIDSVERQ